MSRRQPRSTRTDTRFPDTTLFRSARGSMTIKQKLAVSGAWPIVAAVFNNLSTIIIFVALARLLTPEQFGIVAYATVFVELSRTLVQGGIPVALIQRREWADSLTLKALRTNLAVGGLFLSFFIP